MKSVFRKFRFFKHPRGNAKHPRGNTLPEFLIGAAVFSTILGVSLTHLRFTQKSYQSIIAQTPVKTRLLITEDIVSREIREANDLQNNIAFTNQGPGLLLTDYVYNNGMDGKQNYKQYYAQTYNHLDHLAGNQDYDGSVPVDIGYRGIVFQKNRAIFLENGSSTVRSRISLDNGTLDAEMKEVSLSVKGAGLTKYAEFTLSGVPGGDPQKKEQRITGSAALRTSVPYPFPSQGVHPITVNSQPPDDAQSCPDQLFTLYKYFNYFGDSLTNVRCVEYAYGSSRVLSGKSFPALPEILLTTGDGATYLDEIMDPVKLPSGAP